ncbi:MAG: hypothetical protein DHS20C14_03650 [Phycisphaeraceae bacterium]|nr:MAG: hypothetical protein DHS20C14_03650 [Phycisphaeraceae bacterium]
MSPPEPMRLAGVCHAIFCFDVGLSIDLDALASRLGDASRVRAVRVRRPSPAWFEYEPAPVGAHLAGDPVGVGAWQTEPGVDLRVYDFGAVAVRYRLGFDADPESLVALGVELYDHAGLLADARRHVAALVEASADAIERPHVSDHVEDYAVYAVDSWGDGTTPGDVVDRCRPALARLLQAEAGELAPDRAGRALANAIAYAPTDLAIIDWNAAVLFDHDPEDMLTVLTHANIELVEVRWLDAQLDELLDGAHALLARVNRRSIWPGSASSAELRRFAELQADSALLFEGVNNAIKLIGDQHLARVYDIASGALNLPQWDASVLRKLAVAESVYQKMSDRVSTHRLEVLEWIIIILILVSIVMPFVGLGY